VSTHFFADNGDDKTDLSYTEYNLLHWTLSFSHMSLLQRKWSCY